MGEKGGDEKQVSQPLPQFLPDDWYTCNVGATTITTERKKCLCHYYTTQNTSPPPALINSEGVTEIRTLVPPRSLSDKAHHSPLSSFVAPPARLFVGH